MLFWQPIMQRRRQQQRLVHIRGAKALSHGRILTPYARWKSYYVWCFCRIYSRQTPSHAQLQIELLPQQNPDHLPRPEGKFEAELQRTLARDATIQPPHLGSLDLHRPTLQGPGLQPTPTAAAVSGQPSVN